MLAFHIGKPRFKIKCLTISTGLLLIHLDGVTLFHAQGGWGVCFIDGGAIKPEPHHLHAQTLQPIPNITIDLFATKIIIILITIDYSCF